MLRGALLVVRELWLQTEGSVPPTLSKAARSVRSQLRSCASDFEKGLERRETGSAASASATADEPPLIKGSDVFADESTGKMAQRSGLVGEPPQSERLLPARDTPSANARISSEEKWKQTQRELEETTKIPEDKQETVYKVDEEHFEPLLDNSTPGRPRPNLRENKVPSTPIQRAFGFGSLFTGLAMGTIAEATRRATGISPSPGTSTWLSDANAERLASTLCRMRGAALKLGQMLSIQDDTVLPAPLAVALEKVRAGADRMPDAQLNAVLAKEFGREDWEESLFQTFDRVPIAAASLGQVHYAVTKDGKQVVLKVQYPGVAESIESDVANLRRLVRLTGVFPKGLFIDRILDVVGSELSQECDYLQEAEHQKEMARLLKDDPSFKVPYVVDELSTSKVLTMEYVAGLPLDRVAELSQASRDRVGRMLLRLTLRELFEFGYVQSDPNFANYFYDPGTSKLILLDFGATKKYPDEFVDTYAELVWAAAEHDRVTLLEKSQDIGLLNGKESNDMIEAHCQSAFDIAEPFSRRMQHKAYDFGKSSVSAKVAKHGPTFLRDRLVPPPEEIYSLHRKLSGAYMACVKIKARFPCRDLLEVAIKQRLARINADRLKQQEQSQKPIVTSTARGTTVIV